MKLKTILPIFILLILFSCVQKEIKTYAPAINTYSKLMPEFANPSSGYRPAPLWVWNNDVSKADIDRTLHTMKEMGMGGVFVHPRPGLITDYLSPKWLELFKYGMEVAKQLDMKYWIYDENSYPSGFAFGLVQQQMPESYNQGDALIPRSMDSLTLDKKQEAKYIFKDVDGKWQDITAKASNEKGKEGKYVVFSLRDTHDKSSGYVDILVKGVTEKFIDITFTKYKETAGAEFGKAIPGSFTDEPHISGLGAGRSTFLWTPDLISWFKKLNGYDLGPNIISLYEETGEWQKVRHDYYSTILDMFINRWSKPMQKYLKENNLIFTGHYWEHGWPDLSDGPDNMAMYAYHDLPGIDMLYNSQIERPDQFGNNRSVKELASVANQFGRERTLSETYGGSGWDLRFDEMKRNGDWEYTLGVNFMNQHHAWISLMGDRKHDYPPSWGTFEPWWKQYHYQADYFSRLSVALSSGIQQNRILMLEPTTTAWMYYTPVRDRKNKRFDQINPAFTKLLSLMEQEQVEYDLGCENIIRDWGRIEGAKFRVNQRVYDLVVIPDVMDNIDKSTYKLLKKYLSGGGKVIQLGEGAKFIDGVPSKELEKLTSDKNWIKKADLTPEVLSEYMTEPDFSAKITNPSGLLFHHRRKLADGQVLFFSNFSMDNNAAAEITVAGASVEGICPYKGKAFPVAYKKEGNKITFPVNLYPSGSYMVYVHKDSVVAPAPEAKAPEKVLVAGSKTVIKCLSPNILPQDYLKLSIAGSPEKDLYYAFASDSVYKHFGFPGSNPWRNQLRIKEYTYAMNKDKEYKMGDKFEVAYNFEIGAGADLSGIKLVVERPWLYKVTLNDKIIHPDQGKTETWKDPVFDVFNVDKLLKKGQNEVRLVADPFSVHCEIEPVYLLGNFSVEPTQQGWQIAALKPLTFGPWDKQGIPFYGEQVSYSKTVKADKAGKYEIELPNWFGTVATVNINGKEAGIIQTKPYLFKTDLNGGENIIEIVVAGSLNNTFGPYLAKIAHGVGGRPANFHQNAPKVQPAGNDFTFIGYGLMEDFKVYELK
jgi:hypothetical protein